MAGGQKGKAKRAPMEPSGESEWKWGGFVGGEVLDDVDAYDFNDATRFGDVEDWDNDEGAARHVAEDVSGSEYDYLGHFRNKKFLRDGHNTTSGGEFSSLTAAKALGESANNLGDGSPPTQNTSFDSNFETGMSAGGGFSTGTQKKSTS